MGHIYYIAVALPCTVGAIVLALVHIYRHLLNYTEPTYQRYIVRIIFMVPVSSISCTDVYFMLSYVWMINAVDIFRPGCFGYVKCKISVGVVLLEFCFSKGQI